jgi:hypothetical protein
VRNVLMVSVLSIGALSASCAPNANFTGTYTMFGQRTAAAACNGSPPSGAIGSADVHVTAPDSTGTFTMEMRIGTSNACVLTLTQQGGSAAISNANNCDATVAPPFFTVGSGNLSEPNGQLRLAVHWSMNGAAACSVDDLWTTLTR